jgi:thioredoxin-like negative regulator of GroEL
VVSIDVEESQDIADEYGVTSLPRFLFFKNGVRIDDYTGSAEDVVTDK